MLVLRLMTRQTPLDQSLQKVSLSSVRLLGKIQVKGMETFLAAIFLPDVKNSLLLIQWKGNELQTTLMQ